MENLKKVLEFGKVDAYGHGRKNCLVTVEIRIEDKGKGPALSICGNVWNPRHSDIIQGGQCLDSLLEYPELKRDKKYLRIVEIWDRWHLNDMRAACEHQRASGVNEKTLTLTEYTWGDKFHTARRAVENAEATPEQYAEYKEIAPRVYACTTEIKRPKYESQEVKSLLSDGWIKPGKTEEKAAGWVYPEEHPEGMLCRPCPVCGYRYGSSWLTEELPQSVIEEVKSW